MSQAADQSRFDHPAIIVSSSVVGTLVNIVVTMSFAALIFQGELAGSLHLGFGLMFFSCMVYNVVMSLRSSLPYVLIIPQDIPSAILSIAAAAVVAGAGGRLSGEALGCTVVAMIGVSSLVMGGAFYLLGRFRLGDLVRYIPYPVVGGFLAGTGWLLFTGGISIMADVSVSVSTLGILLQREVLLLWVPGMAFGFGLFAAVSAIRHHLTAPIAILAGCLLFYGALLATGTNIQEAKDMGLLIAHLPDGGIWAPPGPDMLGAVDWGLVLESWLSILTIALISSIAMLLNSSGLELMAGMDMNLNRELRTNGLAAMACGLGGGAPGYCSVSLTALNRALGARGRLPGLVGGLLCGAILLTGASVLAYFPLAILGGLVVYLGLGFLKDWLVDTLGQMSWLDYGLLLAILAHVALVGFLQAVAFGLVASVLIFVLKYSRASVVRSRHDGSDLPSDVERNPVDRRILALGASRTLLLRLQGYLFFGTVSKLLDPIRGWLASAKEGDGIRRFIILDLGLVTGFDSSMLNSLSKVYNIPGAASLSIAICCLSDRDRKRFERYGHDESRNVHFFADRAEAVEWCEEGVLNEVRREALASTAKGKDCGDGRDDGDIYCLVEESLNHLEHFEDILDSLSTMLEEVAFARGDVLITEGQEERILYFLESGSLEAVQSGDRDQAVRVRKILAGSLVGEMSLYRDCKTSVTVRALTSGKAWALKGSTLDELNATRPDLALKVHRLAARMLSYRLEDSNTIRRALL